MNPIRVSIVEDNDDERRALAELVRQSAGLACVSTHASLDDARRTLTEHHPDVVLLDLQFGTEGSAAVALPGLKALLPHAEFIMLTRFDDDELVFQCLKGGAFGYWLKSEPMTRIIESIREIRAGGASMSCVIARKVINELKRPAANPETLAVLSPREREILAALAVGDSYKEIAAAFGISYDTVRAHIRSIYEKLQVHSRAQAVAKFHRKK